jgi:hypothetical protein
VCGRRSPIGASVGVVPNVLNLGAMRLLLRIILLVGNAAFFAWLAYIVVTIRGSPKDPTFWLAVGILTFLALNFLYVLLVPYIFQRNPSRLFRLIDVWFDAKESELRKRADRSRQDTRPHRRPGDRDE